MLFLIRGFTPSVANSVGKGGGHLEKYYVRFEMDNGVTHSYEIDDTSIDKVYTKIINSPDGWIEFEVDDEKHFLNAAKIARVTTHSETVERKRVEDSQIAAEAFRNIKW